jgi:NAD-dependent deacetylase
MPTDLNGRTAPKGATTPKGSNAPKGCDTMQRYQNIVVLTGAGISAESGISTFRDAGGVWAKYAVEDVATPQGFARNPMLVHAFYNGRRAGLKDVKPNAGHAALAKLEAAWRQKPGHSFLLITQNVDNLHEIAGSQNIVHMHGELLRAWCVLCDVRMPWTSDLSLKTACPHCAKKAGLRPDVVWFGEMPYQMDRLYEAVPACDLFISIGTSGHVYPAAGFVAGAKAAGAHTVELNLEPSEGASHFAEAHHGPGTEVVPAYVETLLALS